MKAERSAGYPSGVGWIKGKGVSAFSTHIISFVGLSLLVMTIKQNYGEAVGFWLRYPHCFAPALRASPIKK
jgi:hypothetical protein